MIVRVQLLYIFCVITIFVGACSSSPREFPIREFHSGTNSGRRAPLTLEIRTAWQYEQLATGLRARNPECDFPAATPNIQWGDELLLVILAGETQAGTRVRVANISIFGNALLVAWRKELQKKESVFLNSDYKIPPSLEPPRPLETPFTIVIIDAWSGGIRFLEGRHLLD
ncbi:MAG: hypothetical protein ACKVS6_16540 [Planctomycetota bacterium]